jgi:hypothetical protein
MVLILLALVSPGRGANRQEVLGVASRQPALKVIDEKCLACHNRQRIETAARDRRDMERIVRRMERKGVALTEKERQVLGHFWQKNPFAEDAEKSSPSRRGGGALPR